MRLKKNSHKFNFHQIEKKINIYEIRVPKSIYPENLKVLAQRIKKLEILTIFGPPRAFLWIPKSKFRLLPFVSHGY